MQSRNPCEEGVGPAGQSPFLLRAILFAICLLAGLGLRHFFSFDPNEHFGRAILGADRVVIRNGGHDCCGNDVDSQEVFVEFADSQVIEEISQKLTFQRRYPSLLPTVTRCRCCGYPGIDWYRDGKRVALTSVQHRVAVRWVGFDHDAILSAQSSRWLTSFLDSDNVPKTQPITEAPADVASATQN